MHLLRGVLAIFNTVFPGIFDIGPESLFKQNWILFGILIFTRTGFVGNQKIARSSRLKVDLLMGYF